MNPIALIGGFAPLVLFALLDQRIPVVPAAALAAAVALIVVLVTSKHGISTVPLVQAITLAAIAGVAFGGDWHTQHLLAVYGRGIASLMLATFMLATARFTPFTATIARAGVPRELWHTPRFIDTNRRISIAWGVAVLVMGAANLVIALMSAASSQTHVGLFLRWGPTAIAVIFALSYTRRVVADAQAGMSRQDDVERSTSVRIETLVAEHRAAVLDYVNRLTGGDVGWAEDVVQETFLRAWRHQNRLIPERGSVRGWLLRVAHNLVMDGYRSARMRHGESPLDEAGEMALPEPTDQILSAHMVSEALYQLPELHRQALTATFLNDRTAAQAASELNVPVGTVKSRVFYGLRMMRSILREDVTDEECADNR